MPKMSELKGPRIKVTDSDHLMAMGKTHAFLQAIEQIGEMREETPTTGLTMALYALKAMEAENRVRVMQNNIRLVARQGIDLDKHDVFWDGHDEIIAEPRGEAVEP